LRMRASSHPAITPWLSPLKSACRTTCLSLVATAGRSALTWAAQYRAFAVNEFTDPRHPSLDRGICDSDLAQQFKMAGVWQTPKFNSLGIAGREVLGGWSVSGILDRHDGFPFSIMGSGAPNGDGDNLSRAKPGGDPAVPGGSTISEWFNTKALRNRRTRTAILRERLE